MTEKYKRLYIALRIMSAILVIAPISIYTTLGFIQGTTGSKVVLGMCLTTALIFVIINVIAKHKIRSTIWIVMIGLYMACDNIIPLLIIVATLTVIDEFVLEPLYKKYREKYVINKEIDKR